MMRTSDHPRSYPLRRPHADDEIPDLGAHAGKITGLEPELVSVLRVYPQRIGMRDLVEPFCVSGSRVNQNRQSERRDQNVIVVGLIEIAPVDVATHIGRQRILGPLPVGHRLGIELELARGRVEPAKRVAVDHDTDHLIAGCSRLNDPRLIVNPSSFELSVGHSALVLIIDVCLYGEGAVSPHEFERRKPSFASLIRKARYAVLKDPAIVLAYRDLLARAIGRLEMTPHAELTRRIDAPRKLNPKLILLPHLSGIRLVGEIDVLAFALSNHALNRLTK